MWWWILCSAVVVGAAYGAALYIDKTWGPKEAIVLGPDVTVFALLYVVAQAIERMLEPVSKVLFPTEEKKQEVSAKKAEAASLLAANDNAGAGSALQAAADAQGEVDTRRSGRAVLYWAIGTGLAFLLSAVLGLFVIDLISTVGTEPANWIDMLVTGMVIGAGTKPLHDLISRIEKAKEKAEDSEA